MIRVVGEKEQVLVAKAYDAGQDHIFRFWDQLDDAGRKHLLSQLAGVDFQLLRDFCEKCVAPGVTDSRTFNLSPPPVIPIPKTPAEKSRAAEAALAGKKAISEGRLGLVMVAGGQATRLGISGPKGACLFGPVTGRSIFQAHTEKIQAIRSRYKAKLHWYIMTSEDNDAETRGFFEKNKFFGLPRNSVTFFVQPMVPAVNDRGKLILIAKDSIFLAPNGHGGLIQAMERAKIFEDMESRGITDVFYFQVDNPLVQIADPVFYGHHLTEGGEFSLKSIIKTVPEEKVGLIIMFGRKPTVIEYSDLSEEEQRATDKDGQLKLRQGNPAIHIFSREFLQECAAGGTEMPYHFQRKAIPYLDREGRLVTPKKPNGIKFELFIFDLLAYARKVVIMETERAEEFAPIKNPTGVDSLETARRAMTNLFGSWLEKAGVKLPRDKNGNVEGKIEISPRYALDADELAAKVDSKLIYSGALLLA
jgi:UDP-N-acetylglucosamine/UDP-N-acetylgalactosamine diphosphorylase